MLISLSLAAAICWKFDGATKPEIQDFQAQHNGLKFKLNDPLPRFDLSGHVQPAWLGIKYEKASGGNRLQANFTDAQRAAQESRAENDINRWKVEIVLEDNQAPFDPNTSVVLDGHLAKSSTPGHYKWVESGGLHTEDVPIEAVQTGSDKAIHLVVRRRYQESDKEIKLPYSSRFVILVKKDRDADSDVDQWIVNGDPNKEEIVDLSSNMISDQESSTTVNNQELLRGRNTPPSQAAEKKNVQQFTIKMKAQGVPNIFSHFMHFEHYDELAVSTKLSSEWRDKSTAITIDTNSLIDASWSPFRSHTLSYFEASTDQAFSVENTLFGFGGQYRFVGPKPADVTQNVKQEPAAGRQAAIAAETPSDVRFYGLDELTTRQGFLNLSGEIGHSFAGSNKVQGPGRSDIVRLRSQMQTPQVGATNVFLQATGSVYYLPFPHYRSDKRRETFESMYEADLYIKTNAKTAFRVGYGGGANPASGFAHNRPVVKFGFTGSF